MYWEQIGFCIFITSYFITSYLSLINTHVNKRRARKRNKTKREQGQSHVRSNQIAQSDQYNMQNDIQKSELIQSDIMMNEENEKSTEEPPSPPNSSNYHFLEQILKNSVTFNSSFLIVGSLSEANLYGVRMVGNIMSVTLGYIYSAILVQPFMYNLDESIRTPYQYFGKRYRNSKYVRAITASAGLFFFLSYITLFLWCCAILLITIIPEIPLWMASVIVGLFSLSGSVFGGFTQSTLVGVIQFLILLSGLSCAILATIFKNERFTPSEIWKLAVQNERTNFFDTHVDTHTRYTILNQLTSLSMPWTAKLALFLPNFRRYRQVKSREKSRLLFVSNYPWMVLINLLLIFSGGIFVYVFFYGCSPLYAGKIINKNQLGTYWLYMVLSKNLPSLCGILFASILAFSMNQHSHGTVLIAETIYEDIFSVFLTQPVQISDYARDKIIILFSFCVGLLAIGYSIAFHYVRNTAISLFFLFNNSINSPLLGLYLLSVFNKYANGFGAMFGFCSNLSINTFLALGVLTSNLQSQEFPPDTSQCANEYHTNMTSLNAYNVSSSIHNYLNVTNNYYPTNPALVFLFRIAPIWYCVSSVIYTFVVGSFASFLYSLIKTKSFDADAAENFAEERKQYLYYNQIWSKDYTDSQEVQMTHL